MTVVAAPKARNMKARGKREAERVAPGEKIKKGFQP